MTRVITSACVGTKDMACVDVCPVDCIHPHADSDMDKSVDDVAQLYIDPDECIDCGACESACPVSAIFPDDEIPAGEEASVEANAAFFA
ncbi:MAG: 4Fe-4S dicluster domain-containing protein [Thermoplasmatota archaeon]